MSTGSAVVAIPGNRVAASTATCRAPAAAMSAFDGTQPVFTQVPPSVPRSIITTDFPSVLARIAAANAPPPDPMMARSYFVGIAAPVNSWLSALSQPYWTFQCRGRSSAATEGDSNADRRTRREGGHYREDPSLLRGTGPSAPDRAHAVRIPRLRARDGRSDRLRPPRPGRGPHPRPDPPDPRHPRRRPCALRARARPA